MSPIKKPCFTLLAEYKSSKKNENKGKRLFFEPVELGVDVYNITAPFQWNGEILLLGRVEKRDSEDSHIVFFSPQGEKWIRREDIPSLRLQDPFFTVVQGQLIVGGVEIFPHPKNPNALSWRTVFYRGDTPHHLTRFACGPDGQKDIRLLELPDGKILVFTRPQGEKGGRGKIGSTILNNLNELTAEAIDSAPLIPDHFIDEEWGGVNEVHLLKNGKVGALSHIACFDEKENRHYYASCFCMDLQTGACSDMKIIACREDFPPGEAKRPDLVDVLFSGGLVREANGTATLYCGASDAEAYSLQMPDPFLEYEAK